ncbi:MAG: phage integrase N-terminal SAM-like domain-containing protein, partial [Rhodoplanes sp.]
MAPIAQPRLNGDNDRLADAERSKAIFFGSCKRGWRGTFQIARYGLQFFYCHTLGRVWELFGEKKDPSPRQKRLPEALAEGTRQSHVRAVRQLTAFYRRAPDQLSEEEVRRYLLGLRQRGVGAARSRSRDTGC